MLTSLALLGILTSCTGSDDPAEAGGARTAGAETPLPTATISSECAAGEGRVVEQLPDIVVPAVVVPAVTDDDGDIVLDAFTIPAQLVDAGCVIRYDAPGGCLGAVTITGATIPAVTIPGAEVGGRVFSEVTAPSVSLPSVKAERACQVEEDGKLATVSRDGIVREQLSRYGTARSGGIVDGVEIPTVRLEPVRLPDVDVDPARLARRDLPGQKDVMVMTGEGRTAYVAPSGVLFDTDQASLRPDATAALLAIARQIKAAAPGAHLLIEGHTDDRGDEAYGVTLSERRAEAVAAWLVNTGGFKRSLITTRGLGETAPVVPNTNDANRQKNRRVVITVLER